MPKRRGQERRRLWQLRPGCCSVRRCPAASSPAAAAAHAPARSLAALNCDHTLLSSCAMPADLAAASPSHAGCPTPLYGQANAHATLHRQSRSVRVSAPSPGGQHLQADVEVVGDAGHAVVLKGVVAQPLHGHVVQEADHQLPLLPQLHHRREGAPTCTRVRSSYSRKIIVPRMSISLLLRQRLIELRTASIGKPGYAGEVPGSSRLRHSCGCSCARRSTS